MTRIERLHSIGDFERAARRRLPRPIFDIVAGGAGDEITLQANREALRRLSLRPRVLEDVSRRDTSISVFGEKISLPVMLAPVGFQRMLNFQAELASARAAASAGTIFICNTISTYNLEDVASATRAPKWFQLYMPADRGAADDLITRVETAGYSTLCLTVDTAVGGNRERDLRNRVAFPLRPTPRTIFEVLRRPGWAADFLRGRVGRKPARIPMTMNEAGEAVAATARPITMDDLEWLRDRWKGYLVVKGVLRADDCEKVLDHGADGVVVSNHGGRQLDSTVPTITALGEMADVVSGRGELFVDGGFRRGSDVVKALAMGARAVLVGRPYLYGLAIGGQAGVERVLEILRSELDSTLALLGCRSISELEPHHVTGNPPG